MLAEVFPNGKKASAGSKFLPAESKFLPQKKKLDSPVSLQPKQQIKCWLPGTFLYEKTSFRRQRLGKSWPITTSFRGVLLCAPVCQGPQLLVTYEASVYDGKFGGRELEISGEVSVP